MIRGYDSVDYNLGFKTGLFTKFFRKKTSKNPEIDKVSNYDQDKISKDSDDQKLRDNLTDNQIDKMVKDSFPASDPPSTY